MTHEYIVWCGKCDSPPHAGDCRRARYEIYPDTTTYVLNLQRPCGLCGHVPACGIASVWEPEQIDLCHTDDHSCYDRWNQDERPREK